MAGFGDAVQKAFYLGVGLASYAGEQAGQRLGELRAQAQKLADEMVARGEMTTEEARQFVDEMMKQGKQAAEQSQQQPGQPRSDRSEPRRIEILDDDEQPTAETTQEGEDVDRLHQQVQQLQDELRRLRE